MLQAGGRGLHEGHRECGRVFGARGRHGDACGHGCARRRERRRSGAGIQGRGTYHFVQNVSDVNSIIIESLSKCLRNYVLNAISGKQLEYPVYYDIEQKEILAKGKTFCSAIATNFCTIMEKNKKFCGIYASKSYFDNYFTDTVKNKYSIWVAQYNNECTYKGKYGMWQHSSKGSVSGISGNVDLDISYQNFPEIIKKAHLNGF